MKTLISQISILALALTVLTACPSDPARLGPGPKAQLPGPVYNPAELSGAAPHPYTYTPKVDILFVIDDSWSMAVHQEKLAQNIDNFVNAFEKYKQLDFHIGVTTVYDSISAQRQLTTNKNWLPQPAAGTLRKLKKVVGTNPKTGMQIFEEIETGPRYITRETPDLLNVLKGSLQVGQYKLPDGGTENEESFSPIIGAFTEPVISSPTNAGFYRQDADLKIIFITDTDDQTPALSAAFVHDFLTNQLKNNPTKVSYHGVLAHWIPPEETNLPYNFSAHNSPTDLAEAIQHNDRCHTPYKDEEYRPIEKLETLINLQSSYASEGNKILSLCSNYGTRLAQIGLEMRTYLLKRDIVLTSFPEEGNPKHPFTVSYGLPGSKLSERQIIPRSDSPVSGSSGKLVPYEEGWSYDHEHRIVTVHGGVTLKPYAADKNPQLFVDFTPVINAQ